MKEQALALTEQPRQVNTQQSEFFMLAEEAQRCVLYNSHVKHTLDSLMYSVIVTIMFTTLRSGRGLVMRFVSLYVGEGSAEIRPSIPYNLHWAHTCFVMYCTNAYACDLCTTVTFLFITLRLGKGLITWFVQLVRGALYVGEGSIAIWPSVLYNSLWAHTCFIM